MHPSFERFPVTLCSAHPAPYRRRHTLVQTSIKYWELEYLENGAKRLEYSLGAAKVKTEVVEVDGTRVRVRAIVLLRPRDPAAALHIGYRASVDILVTAALNTTFSV